MKKITDSFIPKMLKVGAITIYPYVFFADEVPSGRLIKHESVHCNQVRRYGWLRFYVSYLMEYFSYRVRGDSSDVSYRKITYEIEAYAKENK